MVPIREKISAAKVTEKMAISAPVNSPGTSA